MVFFQLNVTGLLFQSFRTASPPDFLKLFLCQYWLLFLVLFHNFSI